MEDKELLQAIGQVISEQIVPRLDKMDGRLDKMDGRLDKMDGRLDKIDGRLDNIDDRLDNIDDRLGNIELVIENELRPNIQKLAEGYEPYYQKTCVNNIKLKDLEEKVDILEISTKHNSNEIKKINVTLKDAANI